MKSKLLVGIIREYIKSKEPIGSGFLKSQQNLKVSSATIRNYFKILEKEGALFQPHASSGRIPTISSMHSYWRSMLKPMIDDIVYVDIGKLSRLSLDYGLYCVAIPLRENYLEGMVVNEEYIVLRFSRYEAVIVFSDNMCRFLQKLIGFPIGDLIKISADVGARDLNKRLLALEQVDFQENCYRFGTKFIKDIIYDNEDIFLDLFQARALFKYGNGIHFNRFLPSGYMAVIHDVNYNKCKARMMCAGNVESDYENFYIELIDGKAI